MNKMLRKIITVFVCLVLFVMQAHAENYSITISDASNASVSKGDTDVPILRIFVDHPKSGAQNDNWRFTDFVFTPENDDDADVTAAYLYYTATSTFATTNLVGTDNNIADGISFTGLAEDIAEDSYGYFWLAYDVSSSATGCDSIHASITDANISRTETDADGSGPGICTFVDNAVTGRQIQGFGCWSYCSVSGSLNTYGYIEEVTINEISNSTTFDGYVNTGQSTSLIISESYYLTLVTYQTSTTGRWSAAWIDWNNDGDFSDTGEEIVSPVNSTNSTREVRNVLITVPATAAVGTTTMRVVMKYGSSTAAPTPCDAYNTYVDWEDYTINVITAHCANGVLDADEVDVDCGGADCPACPHCDNGVQDADETGVDCGGSDCVDCQCVNSVQDANEVGVDCGGPCDACACGSEAAPGNDDACNSTTLSLDGSTYLTDQYNCNANVDWYGGCVPSGNPSVWYDFTLTGSNDEIILDFANYSFVGDVELLLTIKNDACPADADMTYVSDYCGDPDGTIMFTGLTAGQEYHLMVSTASGEEGYFNIVGDEEILGTPDSDPCATITIPQTFCPAGYPFSNVGATSIFPNESFVTLGCGDNFQYETFFKFVADSTAMDVTVYAGTIGGDNAEIHLMQPATLPCASAVTWNVYGYSCPAWGETATFTGLTIGETYYISIDNKGNSNRQGTFGFCTEAHGVSSSSGGGSNCANAIDINALGVPFVDANTTDGAGNHWDEACDYFYYDLNGNGTSDLLYYGWDTEDRWYTYTVTDPAGEYITYDLTVDNNSLTYDYPIVSVTTWCPDDFRESDWFHTDSLCYGMDSTGANGHNSYASYEGVFEDTIPCQAIYLGQGTYYFVIDHAKYLIDDYGGANTVIEDNPEDFYDYTFSFNSMANASNNECGGAYILADSDTVSGNNAGCNYSFGPNDPVSGTFCAASTENLAWFAFEPTTDSVVLSFYDLEGSIQWGIVEGSCGGTFSSAGTNYSNPGIYFSDANDPCDTVAATPSHDTIYDLTAGSTYYLVVDGNGGTPSSFNVVLSGISSTLPVELLFFEVEYNKLTEFVDLNWETASETNNSHFVIERSDNGHDFYPVGRVDGAGYSNQVLDYIFTDKRPLPGISYYRLKQIDFDNNYSYSEIQSVKILKTGDVEVFPNPVDDILYVKNIGSDDVEISVVNTMGADVMGSNMLVRNDNMVMIDISHLEAGVYLLKLRQCDMQFMKRIIVK